MCKQCELKPVYEFTNKRKLCARCFINYFQKKFLYTIRKFKMINIGEIIGYKDSENFREVVLQDVLKMFSEKGNVKLIKLPSKKRISKIAISSTIDLESDKFIFEIIKGNLKELDRIKAVDKNIIKPLYLFLDKEVLLYAKLKRLKYKKEKIKRNKLKDFVNGLEEKHPEVKRAIINSYLKLS